MDAAHVQDHRLGRALAALWTAGLDRLYGVVRSRAIVRDALDLGRRHTDATSLKRDGASERHDDEAGPLVTCGDRRDHRPDLTPRLWGRTVTADGVPVWGHSTDGHQRDRTAQRFPRTPRRQHLPALGAPLVVADRQVVAGETRALAAAPRCRWVTLVPQPVGLRQAWVAAPELRALPLRWERPGRRQGETDHDRGASRVRPYRGQTASGAVQALPRRLLVVEAPPLAQARAPRRAAAQPTERRMLAERPQHGQRRTVAGEPEAPQAAMVCRRGLRLPSHPLTATVSAAWVSAQRTTRGRPPKEAPRPQGQVWRVTWPGQEATEAMSLWAQREGRLVRATTVLEVQPLSDAERRRAYTGQPAAELRCKGATKPAALAPICLEPPTRMAALGCLDLIALRVYTLVERQVRNSLAARRETLPDRPMPRQRPTARTVCHLRRHIAVVTLAWAGRHLRQVTTLHAPQLHVIDLLG